ncbi:acetylcholinesterase-like [Tropilaelaps mercedesae]|uniref:Carboxylic ester hydrolase n=1 Tax=Tropilaelaps mercedesae TaxID=418985 RepID=A0A1V9XQR8_9ACAR|nr:acetylcholinesterase-like [Tropilaelaps mercedesae]
MLGFLNIGTEAAPGNQGLWDTFEALRWVKKNARAFGGNPNDITLWGQSAGAITVGIFMASPIAENLFHRAILQSGATSTGALLFKQNTPKIIKSAFVRLGCMNETDDWEATKTDGLKCIKELDLEEMLNKLKLDKFGLDLIVWQPTIYDGLIPSNPFSNKGQRLLWAKDILMTSVSSEGTLFAEIIEKLTGGAIEDIGDFRTVVTVALKQVLGISLHQAKLLAQSYLTNESKPTGNDLKRLISVICGDMLFYCPLEFFAEAAKRNDIRVYRGSFEPRPSYSFWPEYSLMSHADDVPLSTGKAIKFHANYKEARLFHPTVTINPIKPEEVQWALDTVRIFGDFVRNG